MATFNMHIVALGKSILLTFNLFSFTELWSGPVHGGGPQAVLKIAMYLSQNVGHMCICNILTLHASNKIANVFKSKYNY